VVGVSTVTIVKKVGRLDYGAFGVGFAIPSSLAARLLMDMAKGSLRAQPWLGVIAQDLDSDATTGSDATTDKKTQGLTDQAASAHGQGLAEGGGAMVFVVLPDGPAEEAGLRGARFGDEHSGWKAPAPGDFITAIDGVPVRSVGDLAWYLATSGKHVGDVVELQVTRDGEVQVIPLRLGARSDREADLIGAL
jgi:S1-C subfamily serine protease